MHAKFYCKYCTKIGTLVINEKDLMTDLHPKKIVSVVFWKENNAKEPVRYWLKSLTKQQKKIIGEDIKTVEMGWPLGMPLVKSLGRGIWEVRSNFKTV